MSYIAILIKVLCEMDEVKKIDACQIRDDGEGIFAAKVIPKTVGKECLAQGPLFVP